jgi:hypothetical protein
MAKLISTWEELAECKSETHKLDINVEGGNGWITPKKRTKDDYHNYYLSTHTFYGHEYVNSQRELQKRGFDVEIANWDAKTGGIN